MAEPNPASVPGAMLEYAPRSGARRALRWIRPGSAGFFGLVLLLAAAGTWGGWKWMLYRDRKALEACATLWPRGGGLEFHHAPSRGALRHLARLPGRLSITLDWPADENPGAAAVIGSVNLPNIYRVRVTPNVDADALLKQMARPDSGLKGLDWLNLSGTNVSDAGLSELSRADSGLKALSILELSKTQVTDAGLTRLARPDCGLKHLTWLDLDDTRVTDVGLKDIARPDTALKSLTALSLSHTQVTDSGLRELARLDGGLTAMAELYLDWTQVTDAGLQQVAAAGSGLKQLTYLNVRGTKVSRGGAAELSKARPALQVHR